MPVASRVYVSRVKHACVHTVTLCTHTHTHTHTLHTALIPGIDFIVSLFPADAIELSGSDDLCTQRIYTNLIEIPFGSESQSYIHVSIDHAY